MSYALSRLGQTRLDQSAYRMSTLFPPPSFKSPYLGPVLGSGFPVEPPNPFHGMFAAVSRLSPLTLDSPSGKGGWHPEEKLSVEQALRGFTVNGAYGWLKEKELGSIEVGKWADWVVVDRDVLGDASGMVLVNVEVRETWVGGRKVFGKDEVIEVKGWEHQLKDWLLWSRDVLNGKMWWMGEAISAEL